MTERRRKPVVQNVVALACALLVPLYVLSYAPVVKLIDPSVQRVMDGDELPVYRPVDWLIDNTPLRRPLFWWSELWGVRKSFGWSAQLRSRWWGESSPRRFTVQVRPSTQDDPLSMFPPLPMHHPAKAEIDRIVDNLAPGSEEDYRRLSRRDRYVWDVWWMDTAMMNGGLDHWFPAMAHHAPETLEALDAIGAPQAYGIIKRVCDLFPDLGTDEEIVAARYFEFFQRHGKIDDYLLLQNEMHGNFEEVELDLYQRLLDYWQRADPMAR